MANSVNPDQTAPIGAVCSGSTLFAYILNSSVILDNYLQQTTLADNIFFLARPSFLCMLGNFSCFCCRLLTFYKINFFKKFFQELYQNVKQFVSRLDGHSFSLSGFKLFANVISRRHKSQLAMFV